VERANKNVIVLWKSG